MYVFALFLGISLLLVADSGKLIRISKRTSFIITVLIMLFFIFRFSLGRDINAYYIVFNRISSPIHDAFVYDAQRNIGFNILVYYSKLFLHTYPNFLLLVNLIIFGLIGWTIYKNSDNPLFSIALVVGGGTLEVYIASGIRQAIGMSLFLFAFYRYMPKKQYVKYCIVCLIAGLFQEIALITLVVPIIDILIPYIKKHFVVIAAGLICLMLILFYVCNYYFPHNALRIADSVHSIALRHIFLYFAEGSSFSWLGIAMELVFGGMILVLWLWSDIDKQNSFHLLQLFVILFSVLFYIAMSRFQIISRVCDYLQILFLIFIPNLIYSCRIRWKAILSTVGVLILNAFLLYSDMRSNLKPITLYNGERNTIKTYPYVFIFDEDKVNYYLSQTE